MLRCVLKDCSGNSLIPPSMLSLSVDVNERVPADSLEAVFPYFGCGELSAIALYDGDRLIFDGIIDEQEHTVSSSGELMKLCARSPAALLLDNEAMPCSYNHPSARAVCERYAEPFGIIPGESDDAMYYGELNIPKGTSCWNVIRSFTLACYSSLPRVSSTGELCMKGMKGEGEILFGETEGGLKYTALYERVKRCEEISAVYVKTFASEGYTLPIENEDAEDRGISRRRYLNAVLTESPMRCADTMIRNGKNKAYSLKLRCPGCLLGSEGKNAVVADSVIGRRDGLYISALHYRLSGEGEYTDMTLKRRIN